jgi:anti-sigma factor RsiW
MQKRSDDTLVAYLDGELDSAERQHVEAWPRRRRRGPAAGLAQSATLVRSAYADIVNERSPSGRSRRRAAIAAQKRNLSPETAGAADRDHAGGPLGHRRRRRAVPGLVLGGAGSYPASGGLNSANPATDLPLRVARTVPWLDNAAGYYKLSSARRGRC